MKQIVFRGLDQEALDRQYDTRGQVPSLGLYRARWETESTAVRGRPGSRIDIAYGPSPMQKLDIFPPTRSAAPIQVFFHGGYWCRSDKLYYSFVANGFPEALTVVTNYALCPSVTMDELIEQCRAVIAWVYQNATGLGGDPCRLFISGHSAGAHISTMMAGTDWRAYGLPSDVIKGVAAMSGIFELEPVRLSFMNSEIRLTPDRALHNSPVRSALPRPIPVLIAVGSLESGEFRRQSVDYARQLSATQPDVRLLEARGHHHYSILDPFCDPQSGLGRAVREQMGLA